MIETGEAYEVESRHRRFDGVYRWCHVRGFPLKDADGTILRWCVLLTDIDERKQAESQLAGEKQLLEMIASGRPLTDILTALCRFVEETAVCHCGVYQIDWSGPIFTKALAPSLPASYVDQIEGWPVRGDTAPCGVAAIEAFRPKEDDEPARAFSDHERQRKLHVWPVQCTRFDCAHAQ